MQRIDSIFWEIYKTAKTIKVVTDLSGNIIFMNDYAILLTQYSKKEIIGKNVNIFRPKLSFPSEYYSGLWDAISEHKVWSGMLGMRTKNNEEFCGVGTIYTIFDDDGDAIAYCSKRILATKLEEKEYFERINKNK